jgi:hypothetical protein
VLTAPPGAAGDDRVDGPTPQQGNRQAINREGEYWIIIFDGASCRLRDSRGLRHLATLLRRPHERVPALALERSSAAGGDAPMLDADRDVHERARVNVTRALAAVLRRIDLHHPALARHLRATLRTGAHCTYMPDPRVEVEWEGQAT